MSGQTVGKQITGVIVLEPDGHILNIQKSVIRTLAAIISALPFGLGFSGRSGTKTMRPGMTRSPGQLFSNGAEVCRESS
jgi:uncharacterized RDD family membrane protein YckC